jgi:hypothetical protein
MGLFSRNKPPKAPPVPPPKPVSPPPKMTIDKMIDVAKIVQHNLGKELTRDDIQKTFQCGIVDAIQIHAAISVRKEYKVAGVTFCNEDGTSRQQILRAYNLGEPPFGLATNPVINLVEYEYQGNPAFYVMANGLCVGNLEAVAVPEVKEKFDQIDTLFLAVFDRSSRGKTTYYARINIKYTV